MGHLSEAFVGIDTAKLRNAVAIAEADGDFKTLGPPIPPAMPDWSPVRAFGGYQSSAAMQSSAQQVSCGCDHGCQVHVHDHAAAWASDIQVSDSRSFWGALGCSCFI